MRRVSKLILTLAIAAIIATPLAAADEKKAKKKKKRGQRAITIVRLPKTITLTDDQKLKIAAINKEFAPKMRDLQQKQNKLFTPEQRKARGEALKAARASGKKGRELQKVVTDALAITDEQKKEMGALVKERRELQTEARKKVFEILTDEQKKELRAGQKKGKKGKRKKKKKDADN